MYTSIGVIALYSNLNPNSKSPTLIPNPNPNPNNPNPNPNNPNPNPSPKHNIKSLVVVAILDLVCVYFGSWQATVECGPIQGKFKS